MFWYLVDNVGVGGILALTVDIIVGVFWSDTDYFWYVN